MQIMLYLRVFELIKLKMEDLLKIEVRNGNVEKALRVMKRKLKKEGIFQELKDAQHYQRKS